MSKKPLIITTPLQIQSLVPGGQALATLPTGQKIFLWNALPGETITRFQITKRKSQYQEGIALDIQTPSQYRIPAKDSHFLSTSPWQILDYSYELTQKRALLLELLRQHHLDHPPIPLPITDHQDFFYRNKMEYSLFFDHATQKIHPSFHLRGTHRKIPITTSSLELPAIFTAATEIIAELNTKHRDARQFQSLLLRSDQSGTISGGLLENHRPHPHFPPLTDTLLGTPFTYSPSGFFQINLPLYERALTFIKPHITTQKVLDLYAGVGSIGLSVAPDRDLTLIEINPSAFAELTKNCQSFQNPRLHPLLAPAEDSLTHITSDATIILDPPRAGCDPKLLARLLQVQPQKIIYMSCNPATLARDLALLTPTYHLTALQPFNFFPRTPHLEVVTILTLP